MARTDLRGVFRNLRHVHARLTAAVDVRLRHDVGLSLALFEPMTVVAETRGCRVQDLATELRTSAGSASKLADRLVTADYCRRSPNPADRRSCLLELTSAGHQAYVEALRVFDQELDRQLAESLSAAQLSELTATLRELRSASLQLPPGTTAWTRSRLDVPWLGPPSGSG